MLALSKQGYVLKFKQSKILVILLIAWSIGYVVSSGAYNKASISVWDVLRGQLQLDHQIERPEVQRQIHWLIQHPGYLKTLASAEPYIYHIVTEIQKRNLPGELALLPMIESAFDPFAYSGAGAAGLWQFMPETGHDMGLQQNWWYDDRRSVRASTEAALNYLSYLHKYFKGNWPLAIAAYNAGEGTISRTIPSIHQAIATIAFWGLHVPSETKAYVPKLLALAEIVQYPEYYHVKLPNIPHTPYFQEVSIGRQINLSRAAQLAGISFKELLQLNPAYNRVTTAPNQAFTLLIPQNKVDHFYRNLALPNRTRFSLHNFKHKRILQRRPKATLFPTIYRVIHIVQSHESFVSIAHQYKVTPQDIRTWNHIKKDQALYKEQELVIWRKKRSTNHYTIKDTDNSYSIAAHFHTDINALALMNPHIDFRSLRSGQVIIIPGLPA